MCASVLAHSSLALLVGQLAVQPGLKIWAGTGKAPFAPLLWSPCPSVLTCAVLLHGSGVSPYSCLQLLLSIICSVEPIILKYSTFAYISSMDTQLTLEVRLCGSALLLFDKRALCLKSRRALQLVEQGCIAAR